MLRRVVHLSLGMSLVLGLGLTIKDQDGTPSIANTIMMAFWAMNGQDVVRNEGAGVATVYRRDTFSFAVERDLPFVVTTGNAGCTAWNAATTCRDVMLLEGPFSGAHIPCANDTAADGTRIQVLCVWE